MDRQKNEEEEILDLSDDLEESVNPAVQVRFSNLIKEPLSSEKIDELLIKKTAEESGVRSLNDLIKNLVKEFAYSDAGLSLREFLQRFDQNNLADVMVDSFLNKIGEMDRDPIHISRYARISRSVTPEQIRKAKKQVIREIANYLKKENLSGAVTLFKFSEELHDRFPYLRFEELFKVPLKLPGDNGEQSLNLVERIVDKINQNKARMATEAYKEKFDEDKKGFVMRYMTGEVIKLDKQANGMVFDRKKFGNLMSYLDGLGVDIENVNGATLYEWLAEEAEEMQKHVEAERVNIIQLGVRQYLRRLPLDLPEESTEAKAKLIFQNGFDVQDFYNKHITPSILRYNSEKQKKEYSNPEIKLFHGSNSPEKMLQVIFSVAHAGFLRSLVNTAKEDQKFDPPQGNFMATIRMMFGFNNSPLLDRLSNAEVKKMLEYCMELSEKKFDKNLNEAMHFMQISDNPRDKEIVEACKYLPEIKGCRDLAKLMDWMLNKKAFKADYPQYSEIPDRIIYHQCLMMMKDFAFISKRVFSEDFVRVQMYRELLEKYEVADLNVRKLRNVKLRYRSIREIKKSGQAGEYSAIYDDKGVEAFGSMDPELVDLVMNRADLDQIEYKGKQYELFPIRETKLKKAEITLKTMQLDPVMKVMKPRVYNMQVLIYAGGDQLIHAKDDLSLLLSESRGKQVTDKYRWLIIPANAQDAEILKTVMLRRQSRDIIKLDDPASGVFISNKHGKSARTKSSVNLKNHQHAAIVQLLKFLSPKDAAFKGKLNPTDVIEVRASLETQIQSLIDFLAHNISEDSPSSHTIYRSQRAVDVLRFYFNPQIWGDQYRHYLKEIHQGNKKL